MKTQNDWRLKRVFNLIIVDESGSMSVIRKQAFSGMNETLSSVRAMQQAHPETDQRVTLVTFDSNHTTWHFDDVPVQDTRDLRWDAYNLCAEAAMPVGSLFDEG